jgi:iron complex outermembrane receptor protein
MKKSNYALHTSLFVLASTLCGTAAQAQNVGTNPQNAAQNSASAEPAPSETGQLEDIIVTARKTRESLMSVPVAISAITGATLDRNGLSGLTQIDRSVPNLFILRNSIQPNLAIRGAYTYVTNYSVDSAVGISLDELFLGSTRWIDAAQFDVAQIEVLKGPQGTYFGKNTTAGLINITTRGPTDHLEGYVRGGYEFANREASIEGAIGGPVTDTLGIRVAAKYLNSEGFLHNTQRNDREVSEKSFVGRLTAVWQPTSDITATYKLQREDTKYLGTYTDTSNCTAQFTAALIKTGKTDTCAFDRITATGGSVPGFFLPFDQGTQTAKSWLTSLKIEAKLGSSTLTSITGYTDLTSGSYTNTSFTALTYYNIVRPNDINRQFSQEIRFQTADDRPLRAVVGGYFAHATFTTDDFQGWDALAAVGIPLRFSRAKRFEQKNDTLAAFGELTWRVTDRVRFIAGGRVTNDKKNVLIRQDIGSLENPYDGNATAQAQAQAVLNWIPFPTATRSRNVTRFTPAVTLQYVLPTGQVYVSYKEGFKSGGFDASLPRGSLLDNGFEFQDETAKSYEAGAKFTLLDRRLRFTAAIFRTDFANLQVTALVPPATSLFLNAGGVRSQGVELDGTFAAGGGIQLNAAAGYLDTKYTKYDGAPCFTGQTLAQGCVAGSQNVVGRQVAYAPKVSLSGGANWEGSVGSGLRLGLFADANYRSSHFVDIDLDPLTYQKGVVLVNGRVSLGSENDGWRFSLIGRNLFNQDYASGAADVPLFSRAMTLNHGLARTVKIQFETNF